MAKPPQRPRLPIDGPLGRDAYFAPRVLRGARACRRLGLGTAGLAGVWGPVDFDESIETLLRFWHEGYFLTDTAPMYANGKSEELLGQALARWSGETPVLLTKLEGYPDYTPPAYAPDWRASLEKQYATSLARFNGRRIDGLAMHDALIAEPQFQPICVDLLRELQQAGKIGAIGMGGSGPDIQCRWIDAQQFDYIITFKRIAAVTLQGLHDVAPAARRRGTAVIVASPVFMGLLGSKYDAFTQQPPAHLNAVFVDRARRVKVLADQAGIGLAQLALRFVLSVPSVDFVLAGACRMSEWNDCRLAYEAGPLSTDLYGEIWNIAQDGDEPESGG